jgi:uncharacterized membrane protein YkoI
VKALRQTTLIAGAALLAVTATSAIAKEDKVLPAQQVIAAIQAATAAAPGQVREVEVEREGGKLVVEVTVIGADGSKKELKIDPQTNQIVR